MPTGPQQCRLRSAQPPWDQGPGLPAQKAGSWGHCPWKQQWPPHPRCDHLLLALRLRALPLTEPPSLWAAGTQDRQGVRAGRRQLQGLRLSLASPEEAQALSTEAGKDHGRDLHWRG